MGTLKIIPTTPLPLMDAWVSGEWMRGAGAMTRGCETEMVLFTMQILKAVSRKWSGQGHE